MTSSIADTVLSQVSNGTAYEQLRQLILKGHYKPGERLVEERVAQDLGVSRTPIRQAIAQLAGEGLVESYPNRGAFVRTFTREELRQIFDLRALLEGYAAAQAALRMDDQEFEQIEQTACAMEKAREREFPSYEAKIEFYVEHNRQFHEAIVSACGNDTLPDLLRMLVDLPLQFRSWYWSDSEERGVAIFFHRRIVEALRHRDPDRARAMMHEHHYVAREYLIQRLDEPGEQ